MISASQLDGKENTNEKPTNLLCGIGKLSLWDLNAFKIMDLEVEDSLVEFPA